MKSKEPRVDEVGVSAMEGDLILDVFPAGDWALGDVMVAIVTVWIEDLLIQEAVRSPY